MKLKNNKIKFETFFQSRSNPATGEFGLTLVCDNFKTTYRGPHWQQKAMGGKWPESGHRSLVVSANNYYSKLRQRMELVTNHLIIKKFDNRNLAIKQKFKLSILSLSNRLFLQITSLNLRQGRSKERGTNIY